MEQAVGAGWFSSIIEKTAEKSSTTRQIRRGFTKKRSWVCGRGKLRLTYQRISSAHPLLHHVCLNRDGIFFQMNSLLTTPSDIIIFGINNLAGKIIVKANPTQFIQENNGERKVYRH